MTAVRSRPTILRLPPVTEPDGGLEEALSKTAMDDAGRPLPIFTVLAHHEKLLRRVNSLGALLRTSDLTALAHRELLVLRVAYRTDCTFEFDQHEPIALATGLSTDAIAAARDRGPSASDPVERLLLQLADELYDDDSVADSTWEAVLRLWTPEQVLELVATVAFFRMTAALINSLGVRTREAW